MQLEKRPSTASILSVPAIQDAMNWRLQLWLEIYPLPFQCVPDRVCGTEKEASDCEFQNSMIPRVQCRSRLV